MRRGVTGSDSHWIKNLALRSGSNTARLYGVSPVRTLTANPGDANIDGWIDGADYTAWADHFLQTGQVWRQGDFTGDGLVDGADYTVWADNFAPFPTASLSAVPEPSTLALCGMGAIGLLAYRMRRRRTHLIAIVLVAMFCALPSTISAQVVAPANLNPGDQYQLVFVTSTLHGIDQESDVPPVEPLFGGLDAADYTVTHMAAQGGLLPEWNSIDIVWHAILSTSSHDARDRVPITAPLYNTHGQLVAADQADLWDGSIANPIKYDENGLQVFSYYATWSGTTQDGTWSGTSASNWDNPSGFAYVANLSSVSKNWIDIPFNYAASNAARLYGVSPARTLVANPGDANIDCWIDGADYTAWADHFLQTGQVWRQGDFTHDGLVDGADYAVWADNFAPFPTQFSAVPEPSTLALYGIGFLTLIAYAARLRATQR